MFLTRAVASQEWPTAATVAVAFREGFIKDDCTARDVIMAASARGVPTINGRVPRRRLADLAYECREMAR